MERVGLNRNWIIRAAVLIAFAAICIVFSVAMAAAASSDAEAKLAARESGVRGPYLVDGTFTGKAASYGGPLTAQVTVENGYISDIQVMRTYDDSPYIDDVMAAKIPEMLLEQTYELDVVTNASYSSHGLLNAVRNALVKAGAVEGEQQTTSTNRSGGTSTTALKQRAAERAASEAKPWYEASFGNVLGIDETADETEETGASSSGIAGERLQNNG